MITYNGVDTLIFYKDGRKFDTVTLSDQRLQNSQVLDEVIIGALILGEAGDREIPAFPGHLDELRLYSKALSVDDVEVLYRDTSRALNMTFDEPPGQTVFEDLSANGSNGTCTSCPDSGIPGRSNQTVRFDASNAEFIELATPLDMGLRTPGDDPLDLTVMAWVKSDSFGTANHTILGGGGEMQLMVDSLGRPSMSLGCSRPCKEVTTPPLTLRCSTCVLEPGRWHHLAWSFTVEEDGEQITGKIFFDGVLRSLGEHFPDPFGSPALKVDVGRSAIDLLPTVYGDYFDGLIDHLVIVKKALTSGDIQAIMNEAPLVNLHLDEGFVDAESGIIHPTEYVDESPDGVGRPATCTEPNCPKAGDKGQMREAPVFTGDQLLTLSPVSLDANNMSVSLWVKPTQVKPTRQYLIRDGDEFALSIAPSSTELTFHARFPNLFLGPSCLIRNFDIGPLNKDQWNHVMITMGLNALSPFPSVIVYINGTVEGVIQSLFGFCSVIDGFTLGENFDGSLDEVAIYDTMLLGSEVKALFDYQESWVDQAIAHPITIDGDDPVITIEPGEGFLPNENTEVTVSIHDVTSQVQDASVRVVFPSGTGAFQTTTRDEDTWSFTFVPVEGEGLYTIIVAADDSVGNIGLVVEEWAVDGTPPFVFFAPPVPIRGATDSTTIQGSMFDPGGPIASGPDPSTLIVRLQEPESPPLIGSTINDFVWQSDFSFDRPPYGKYEIEFELEDNVGNRDDRPRDAPLRLDGIGPIVDLVRNLDPIIDPSTVISGTISDIPYPVENRLFQLHFEEPSLSTEFTDSSPNHLVATCTACPDSGQIGLNGNALSFNGNSNFLSVSDVGVDVTRSFTAMTWFNVTNHSSGRYILQQEIGTGPGRTWLAVNPGGELFTFLGGSSLSSTQTVTTGQWHHAAVSYDGTVLRLYLDGVLVNSETVAPAANDGDILIGVHRTFSGFFFGLIDELVLYDMALGSETIYDIANADAIYDLQNSSEVGFTEAQIRYRHARDGDQDETQGTWHDLSLGTLTGFTTFTTWQHTIPSALEGPYHIDLRATDLRGNSTYISNAWSGQIDLLAPRISGFRYGLVNGSLARVTCDAFDFNITDDGWVCPTSALTFVEEEFDWFLEFETPFSKITRLTSGMQYIAPGDSTMTACDDFGHCASRTITPAIIDPLIVILAPANGTVFRDFSPITISGFARSREEILRVDVTVNGVRIDRISFPPGTTEASWSTIWTPPSNGAFTLEAIMADRVGSEFDDPDDTVIFGQFLTVNSLEDPGDGECDGTQCTLREAIAGASNGDLVLFNVTGTIFLTRGELIIDEDLTITGPGGAGITVDGGNASRIFHITNGTVAISNLTIANGFSDTEVGGGIFIEAPATLTLTNSTVRDNAALHGGGIFNFGDLTLTNSTVSRNSATLADGGGLYNQLGSTLRLNNTTITNNSAPNVAGGLLYRGTFTLQNTIIAGNTAGNVGPDCLDFSGTISSSGYNLIGDSTTCGFSPVGPGDQVGTSVSPISPLLGLLRDNGGPTHTHALLRGSPALDAGNPAGCTDSAGNPLSTDQRGEARPHGPACDIGALEVGSVVVNSLADPGDGICDATECTLREAIGIDDVEFSVTGTIILTSGELIIDEDVTITGPGGSGITVDGGNASRIFHITNGTVAISNLTIANGFSDTEVGGGIFIEVPATLTLTNSTVRDNAALHGGGIFNFGNLTLTNSTVSGNLATLADGGGLYNQLGSTLTLNNTTITNNLAPNVAGGLLYRGTFTLQNTIIAGNTAGNVGPDCLDFSGTVFSLGFNLIGDSTTCGFSPVGPGDQVGTSVSPIDPLLGLLRDNGGPTFTHALLTGIPALDAGNPAGCTDSAGNPLSTDQRGEARPQGLICDIGAFESTLSTVNLAPENAVPGIQTTDEDVSLVFSTANGNAISVSDPDAEDNPVEVTLTATRGTLTLSGATSPSFSLGDGTDDPTMTFTDTIPDLNLALDGLTFDPEQDYNGPASLEIVTDDNGHTGGGGPKNDTDTVIIVVRPVNDVPEVSGLPSDLTLFEGEARRIDLDPVVSDVETAPADMSWAGVSSDGVIADSDIDPARAVTIDAKDNGTVDLTLTATDRGDPDNCGLPSESCDGPESANHVIQVNVSNVAPTIALSGASNVEEGSVYILTLGTVTDPGDDAVSQYIVRWGDNSSDVYTSAGDVTHTYSDGPETHVISVDLVDEDGTHTDAGTLTVDVENVAPTVVLTGPGVADEQETKSYSFTSNDPGDDKFNVVGQSCGANGILSNEIFDILSGAGSFDCTFPDGFSTSTVSVQVADSDAANSDPDTLVVTVNNVDPVVEAGTSRTVDEGSELVLDASTFSDPGFDFPSNGTSEDFTGTVNWGDGTPTELSGVSETPGDAVVDTTGTVSGSHMYSDDRSYTVTVCITDDDSGAGCDTFTVIVNNVDPGISSVSNDGPIDEGSSATITVVATDPAGPLDPLSYEYDCNNDLTYEIGPQAGSSSLCAFPVDGSFEVNVRVTDGDGGEAMASTTVIVNNVVPTADAGGPYTVDEGNSVTLGGLCGGCISFR